MSSSPWRSIASPSQRVRSALRARSIFEGRLRRKRAERRRGEVLLLPSLLLGLAPRWGLEWKLKLKGRKLGLELNGEEAEADGEAEEVGDVVVEVGRRLFGSVEGW
jgi:hypothetical protein